MVEEGRPGRLIKGRYRLVSEIGSGGMGRVWAGRDEQLDRPVAVKEVQIHVASARERNDRLARAEREGRNAAALADHPNVVTVYDVVIEDGVPWMVMQLVRGHSLSKALETGPLPPSRVTDIAAAMLSALRAAHSAGIVHRDIKPGNIMLADDGQILLTDFGIAKSGGDETVTSTGGFLGSLEYTAPERAEGAVGDPASDLFSLGVTLFHAVEGVPPFHRDSRTGILTAILLKPLPPMARATGPLQLAIRALTLKAPADRPTVGQAHELLTGTRTQWDPLSAAQTVDSEAIRPVPGPVPGSALSAPRPRPPWQTVFPTSTTNSPIPQVLHHPTTPDDSSRKARKRAFVIAGSAIAAVVVALAVTIGVAESGYGGRVQGASAIPATTSHQAPTAATTTSRDAQPLDPSTSLLAASAHSQAPSSAPRSTQPPTPAPTSPPIQSTASARQTSQSPTPSTPSTQPPPPPGTTPPSTAPPTTAPSTPRTYTEQAGENGAATFTDYHNASGAGPRLSKATYVQVSCKVHDPTIPSVNPDGYWYRGPRPDHPQREPRRLLVPARQLALQQPVLQSGQQLQEWRPLGRTVHAQHRLQRAELLTMCPLVRSCVPMTPSSRSCSTAGPPAAGPPGRPATHVRGLPVRDRPRRR